MKKNEKAQEVKIVVMSIREFENRVFEMCIRAIRMYGERNSWEVTANENSVEQTERKAQTQTAAAQ